VFNKHTSAFSVTYCISVLVTIRVSCLPALPVAQIRSFVVRTCFALFYANYLLFSCQHFITVICGHTLYDVCVIGAMLAVEDKCMIATAIDVKMAAGQ
jgi:hypothetical protein